MCRNYFLKKEDDTWGEEQHNYDHGHDNHDHDEQDEEGDDQLDDCYLMRKPRRKLGHLQLLYVVFLITFWIM